jgi:hypothetical protein
METVNKPQKPFYKEKVFWIVTVIVLIFLARCQSDTLHPLSAEGMSVEERTKLDSEVIKKYLKEQYKNEIQEVKVDHEDNTITVKINTLKGEQYSEDKGEEIKDATEDIIKKYSNKLTLEEMYWIFIKSKDDRLLAN